MNLRPSPYPLPVPAGPDRRTRGLAGVALLALLSLAGCAGGSDTAALDERIRVAPAGRSVVADWNDVDAALDQALDDGEMAVVRDSLVGDRYASLSPWCRVYRVRSITDAEGTVVVAQDWTAETAVEGLGPITVRADLDGPRSAAASERFVKAMTRRLAQLAGRDTAPALDK